MAYDGDRLRANPPATTHALAALEQSRGTLLPDELVRVYRSVNGLYSTDGHWWVIWPLDQMQETRKCLDGIDGYLDRWIAFGDDGTGDPYCFRRADQTITRLSMIDRTHEPVANGLPDFWTMVLSRL